VMQTPPPSKIKADGGGSAICSGRPAIAPALRRLSLSDPYLFWSPDLHLQMEWSISPRCFPCRFFSFNILRSARGDIKPEECHA